MGTSSTEKLNTPSNLELVADHTNDIHDGDSNDNGDGVYSKNETETKQQFVGNADSEKRTVIEVNVDNENNGDYDQENGDNGDYYVDDGNEGNGGYVDDEN